jgi:hypothetical protein
MAIVLIFCLMEWRYKHIWYKYQPFGLIDKSKTEKHIRMKYKIIMTNRD